MVWESGGIGAVQICDEQLRCDLIFKDINERLGYQDYYMSP
jgi:hypothetical protein